MTAEPFIGAHGFLARYRGLRDRLPGDLAARDAAAAAFQRLGLPGRRDEAWKYTDLRLLGEAAFSEALTSIDEAHPPGDIPRIGGSRLVFLDGRFRPDLSDVPAGIGFRTFAEAPQFGPLAQPDRDPLVALNTMLAEDGVIIDVPEGLDAGLLHLAAVCGDGATAAHPRHTVRLAPNARLTLVETATGTGAGLHNPVTEITLAPGAMLRHVRLQNESATAFHMATVYVEAAQGAMYDGFTLNLGGRITRTEIHARLIGPDGAIHLHGAQLLRGSQHADFTSVVRHDAPRCASRQVVKSVLAGHARGVFQGRIEVARIAQKTDGYQMSQTLLLSPDAEIDTKPELEIFADDVKCSHGATVGALDPEQMFYLRSRGVPETEARSILVHAFLEEALAAVIDETVHAALQREMEAWWEKEAI